jgi:hypothetical protein
MNETAALRPEHLVELLADAGDLDAATEALDALRLRPGDDDARLRLQARLFTATDGDRARRAACLTPLRDGAIDELARDGHLLEAAAAWRAMCRAWADEPHWVDRLARVELLLAPLDPSGHDPSRCAVDAALARGDLHGAWDALLALQSAAPHDIWVAQRADALRAVLFGPSTTKPYREGDAPSLREASERASAEFLRTSQPAPERPSAPGGEVRLSRTRVLRVGEK